ncbi:hypothetical protein ACFST9_12965 [Hymenobacter monticola]|uniref:TonB-dependent receptor n=1 Tax=Hymenobacter monticola TaxID=1705399 RepID=A0ABY4BB39_9BACT|nr:hypothetical protein [Hymenobacter monticola]UOE36397.1 hypothetical protein MTP16_23860 [Hymenobacter monticola]
MKPRLLPVCLSGVLLFGSKQVLAQTRPDSVKVPQADSTALKKTEQNRNVMLNADTNTGPRQVNIGLPFTGDITILENEVPVVYNFNPTVPTATWRFSNSLAKLGLLSFAESALTFGKVGFTVQSSDRDPTPTLKGFVTFYGNSFGSSRYDATITGPLSKNGWGFMVNGFQTFDRGNGTNFMYTPWTDKTSLVKLGITKKFEKGNIRVLYKYSDSRQQLTNYNPLVYEGDGKTRALDNFDLGRDSYLPRDGQLPVYDAYTGAPTFVGLDAGNRFQSHNIYLTGAYKFNNDWKLSASSMFQHMTGGLASVQPISLLIVDPDQQQGQLYTYQGTNKAYTGSVQYAASYAVRDLDSKSLFSRAEIARQFTKHSLRFGLTQLYSHRQYDISSGLFLQTVQANPERLDLAAVIPGVGTFKATNDFGLLPAASGGYGFTTDETFNSQAFYASDDIKVNSRLDVGLGGRIEHLNITENKNPYLNDFVKGRPFINYSFGNLWNKVGVASAVLKLTAKFGLVGDFTYNSSYDRYWDYQYRDGNGNPMPDPATPTANPLQNQPHPLESVVLNFGGGLFYNAGDKFSVVSKVNRISKTNIRTNPTITNPADPTQRRTFDPLFYDLETLGWNTDIVTTPFKGFSLHYLLTVQNPVFKNYDIGAFGVTYNYSNNRIPELSKVLMEIDPSYSFLQGKVRVWASVRYYSKQYPNLSNSFSYNAWFENFGGIDYRVNRNIDFKLQVTNFLDQKGVKGSILGADQIIDATPYVGRKIVASAIRPRTIELTANFKF